MKLFWIVSVGHEKKRVNGVIARSLVANLQSSWHRCSFVLGFFYGDRFLLGSDFGLMVACDNFIEQ